MGSYGAAEPGDYPHLSWLQVTGSRQSGLCSGPRRPPHLCHQHGAGTPARLPPPRQMFPLTANPALPRTSGGGRKGEGRARRAGRHQGRSIRLGAPVPSQHSVKNCTRGAEVWVAGARPSPAKAPAMMGPLSPLLPPDTEPVMEGGSCPIQPRCSGLVVARSPHRLSHEDALAPTAGPRSDALCPCPDPPATTAKGSPGSRCPRAERTAVGARLRSQRGNLSPRNPWLYGRRCNPSTSLGPDLARRCVHLC